MKSNIILIICFSIFTFSCTKEKINSKFIAGNLDGFFSMNQNVVVSGEWIDTTYNRSNIYLDLDLDNQIDLIIQSTYRIFEYPEFSNSTFTLKQSSRYLTELISLNDSLYFVEHLNSDKFYSTIDTSYILVDSIIIQNIHTRSFNTEQPNSTENNISYKSVKSFQLNESAENYTYTNTNGILNLANSNSIMGNMWNYYNANPGDTVSTSISEHESQLGSISLDQLYHIPFKIKKNGSFYLGWIQIILSDTNNIRVPKTLISFDPLD